MANGNPRDIRGKSCYSKGALHASVKISQGYRIVPGKSRYIFDNEIRTALAQVYAVSIFYQNVIVFFGKKPVMLAALPVYPYIRRAKIYIRQASVATVHEVKRPPTLIAAGNIFYHNAVNVCEKQKVVFIDGHTDISAVSLGKTVVFSTVKNSPATTDNAYISVSTLGAFTDIRSVMLVYKHIVIDALFHQEMAVLKN
jgi:hypothetical protein